MSSSNNNQYNLNGKFVDQDRWRKRRKTRMDVKACLSELFLSLNRPFYDQVQLYHEICLRKAVQVGNKVPCADSDPVVKQKSQTCKNELNPKRTTSTTPHTLKSDRYFAQEADDSSDDFDFTPPKKRTRRSDSVQSDDLQHEKVSALLWEQIPTSHDIHQQQSVQNRTWGYILQEMRDLVPLMTTWEHEWACFLASICLLYYLIPNCAYIPLLTHHLYQETWTVADLSIFTKTERLLQLQEIYEHVTRPYLSTTRSVQSRPLLLAPLDELFYASFLHFLYDGFGPFLQSRPLFAIHSHQNHCISLEKSEMNQDKDSSNEPYLMALFDDYPHKYSNDSGSASLIHVLAIAIISNKLPSIDEVVINHTIKQEQIATLFASEHFADKFIDLFLSSWEQLQWSIPYVMRVEVVFITSKYLKVAKQLESVKNSTKFSPNDQLPVDIRGDCLRFLRLALRSFDLLSLSKIHSFYSHQALINIALDTSSQTWVHETFQAVLQGLIQPHTNCQATCCKCSEIWIKRGFHRWSRTFTYLKNRILGSSSPLHIPFKAYFDGEQWTQNAVSRLKPSFLSSSGFIRSQSHHQQYFNRLEHQIMTDNSHSESTVYHHVILIEDLIIRYNRSIHQSNDDFNCWAFCECTLALNELLKPWEAIKILSSANTNGFIAKHDDIASCKVAAVMKILSTLLYFLIGSCPPLDTSTTKLFSRSPRVINKFVPSSSKANSIESFNDSITTVGLISIDLLCYQDTIVISSATNFIHVLMLYSQNSNLLQRAQQAILGIFSTSLRETESSYFIKDSRHRFYHILENLAALTIIRNDEIARQLFCNILNNLEDHGNISEKKSSVVSYRLLAKLTKSRPNFILNQAPRLCSLKGGDYSKDNLALSLLVLRSVSKDHDLSHTLDDTIESLGSCICPFSLYQLATEALCIGQFAWASQVLKKLVDSLSSTNTYMWMTALSLCTEAESIAFEDERNCLPEAILKINDAHEILISLSSMRQDFLDRRFDYVQPFSFQISFLSIRRDLWICLAILMRSSQEASSDEQTRREASRQKEIISNSFKSLAIRIFKLNRFLGLFICQQSRKILWSMYLLCRFLSFADGPFCELDLRKSGQFSTFPRGAVPWSLNQMIMEYNKKFKDSNAPRSLSALISFMGSVVQQPPPFPRSFFSTRIFPLAHLRLSSPIQSANIDDCSTEDRVVNSHQKVETLHVLLGSSFGFSVDGLFSNEFMQISTIYFSEVFLWYTINFDGLDQPMIDDRSSDPPYSYLDDCESTLLDAITDPIFVSLQPGLWSDCLSSDEICGSRFSQWIECKPLIKAGFYTICVHVGIRDLDLGEYQAMVHPWTDRIRIKALYEQ